MTSSPEAMGWGFWKNQLVEIRRRGQTRSLRRGAARSWVRWKSQHSKKLCLSLLMSKNLKLKKVIKSFESERILCFSDSYMFRNICECFPYPYEYVYFTCSYLGRIFLDVDMLHIDNSIQKEGIQVFWRCLEHISYFSYLMYETKLVKENLLVVCLDLVYTYRSILYIQIKTAMHFYQVSALVKHLVYLLLLQCHQIDSKHLILK